MQQRVKEFISITYITPLSVYSKYFAYTFQEIDESHFTLREMRRYISSAAITITVVDGIYADEGTRAYACKHEYPMIIVGYSKVLSDPWIFINIING